MHAFEIKLLLDQRVLEVESVAHTQVPHPEPNPALEDFGEDRVLPLGKHLCSKLGTAHPHEIRALLLLPQLRQILGFGIGLHLVVDQLLVYTHQSPLGCDQLGAICNDAGQRPKVQMPKLSEEDGRLVPLQEATDSGRVRELGVDVHAVLDTFASVKLRAALLEELHGVLHGLEIFIGRAAQLARQRFGSHLFLPFHLAVEGHLAHVLRIHPELALDELGLFFHLHPLKLHLGVLDQRCHLGALQLVRRRLLGRLALRVCTRAKLLEPPLLAHLAP
mmetsp:Transcript_42933/g.115611  ORF Transcript_42933/g.115611 Transcript_42933/m.115611 type:complete len:276 (-) Transcript_42933:951-1778(-)